MSPTVVSHSHPHSNTPSLPQETFELIIDELRDSTAALASCSLVRRSWLSRSRFQLFRHVELNVVDPDAFEMGMGPQSAYGRGNISAHRSLSSCEFSTSFSNPNIVACVRGLSLSLTTPQSLSSSHRSAQRDVHDSIPSTIPFTQLRTLDLRCGDIEILDTKDSRLKRLMAIVRCNPYIEHVSLRSMQIDGTPWQMVLSCIAVRAKALKTLVISHVGDPHWRTDWVESRFDNAPVPTRPGDGCPSSKSRTGSFVERLCLSSCSPGKIGYVVRQFELGQVRSLALLDNDSRTCVRVMRRCSDSLHHLSLDIPSNSVKDYIQGGAFEKLSEIVVLQLFLSNVEDLEPVLQMLASTPYRACKLRHLHLDFHELTLSNCLGLALTQTILSKFVQLVPSVRRIVVSVGEIVLKCRTTRLYKRGGKSVDLRDIFSALIEKGVVEIGSPEEWWQESEV